MEQAQSAIDKESLWTYFKENLLSTVDKHVPSKRSRAKKNLPGINRKIHKQLRNISIIQKSKG